MKYNRYKFEQLSYDKPIKLLYNSFYLIYQTFIEIAPLPGYSKGPAKGLPDVLFCPK
jgi:hypothetical protein